MLDQVAKESQASPLGSAVALLYVLYVTWGKWLSSLSFPIGKYSPLGDSYLSVLSTIHAPSEMKLFLLVCG